jgi:hypothetical protein
MTEKELREQAKDLGIDKRKYKSILRRMRKGDTAKVLHEWLMKYSGNKNET